MGKVYICDRCGEDIDPAELRRFGGKLWHWECPDQQRDRAWREIVKEAGRGLL